MKGQGELSFIPLDAEWWQVWLGRGCYRVNAATGECTCEGWRFHRGPRWGAVCRHGKALAARLAADKDN